MVLKGGPFAPSDYLRELVRLEFDPLLICLEGSIPPSDADIEVLEPEREEPELATGDLLYLLRTLISHLQEGERKAVVITDLQALKRSGSFKELTGFIGRLDEEACVNHGLLLLFADPSGFTYQEMAFLERETCAIERPGQLS